MDINTNYSSTTSSTTSTSTTTKSASANAAQTADNTQNTSTPAATYTCSNETNTKGLYNKPNKLTSEQLQALRDAEANSKMQLIKTLTSSLTNGQSGNAYNASVEASSIIFKSAYCAYTCELPALATDPEGANAAISDDGAYSIDSVATRIMDLATALAGDDPEMLEKMRSAVKKGFGSAGDTFSRVTGQNKLPQICQDTYDEVMKRFDVLQEKYSKDDDAQNTTTNDSTEEKAV